MDPRVDNYLAKQRSPQKEICERVRHIMFETFPDIKEQMKWGVPAYGDGKYYMVALKDHVNIGFSINGLSENEIALLEGSGKTMKHLAIHTLEELDEKKLVTLLRLVMERTER